MLRTQIIESAVFMLGNYSLFPDITGKRLYSCNASIIQSNYSKWILLRSYSTIVAAYDKNTEILFVFGYYSNTSVQHVAKFQKWLQKEMNPRPVKRINLYNDSHTGKRAAQKNLSDDYASVIESALNQH